MLNSRCFCGYILSVILASFLISCSDQRSYEALYDMPGFDPGTRPNMFLNSNQNSNRNTNDSITYEEFYQKDFNANQQDRIITEQIINNRRRQDPSAARSRFYNNPYDFVRPNFYPVPDIDRYYVPPNYYRNIERSYMVPTTPNPEFQRFD